jgi:hypothetical protein
LTATTSTLIRSNATPLTGIERVWLNISPDLLAPVSYSCQLFNSQRGHHYRTRILHYISWSRSPGRGLKDGKPEFAYAYSNQPDHKYRVVSGQPLAPGNHIVRVKFEYAGGGIGKAATATLLVDENLAAQGRIERTIPVRFSLDETFDIGEDTGTPVLEEYADQMPFRFTGTLKRFVVVLEPLKLNAEEQRRLHDELAKAMAAVQ